MEGLKNHLANMPTACLNCGREVNENFCPRCGQSVKARKLSWRSLAEEIIHTLTHAERSIAGTSWNLIKNPGKVLKEYISGKRKKYQPPVGFFLIWVTLSILLHRLVIAHSGFHPVFMKGVTFDTPESIHAFIHYGQWLYLLSFPIGAGIFYVVIGRLQFSYIECMVITFYVFAVTSMLFVFCYLLGAGIFSLNVLHWKFYLFQIILSLSYTTWATYSLFNNSGVKFLWLRIIIFLGINLVVILKFLEIMSSLIVKMESH